MSENELFRYPIVDGILEPVQNGRFVGRERELARLVDMLDSRRAATVLVAGYRGAGKTAIINEALRSARSESERIVVRLAPPHLGPDSAEPEGSHRIRSEVLRSLARGLHFAVAGNPHVADESKKLIEQTYEKTYLTELEDHRLLESIASAEARSAETTVVRASFDPSASTRFALGATGAALVGSVGLGGVFLAAEAYGWAAAVATALLIIVLAVAAGMKLERTASDDRTITGLLSEKETTSRVGRYDLSAETLEFELRSSLAALADEKPGGHRVVFVLDELDKLELGDRDSADLEASPVFAILASLKNFFSQGNAIYVFITDDSFWERIALARRAGSYSASHTVFTDRVYVGHLHYQELEDLIDRSVVLPPEGGSEEYERFKNYVCWESNQHVFDALQVLASFVDSSGDSDALLPTSSGIVDGRWQEGNLPDDWLKKSALQKHIGVAYDEARRSGFGEELFNQALWENLHLVCEALLEGDEVRVSEHGVVELPGQLSAALSKPEASAVGAAVERLLIRLERHGAAVFREVSVVAEGEPDAAAAATAADPDAEIVTEYSLVRSVPYPDSSIAEEAALLPPERALCEVVNRLDTFIANGDNYMDLADEDAGKLKRVRALKKSVEETGPRKSVQRATIASTVPIAEELAQTLVESALAGAVETWASGLGATVATALAHASPQSRQPRSTALSVDFAPLVAALGDNDDFFLIGEPSTDNGVLVLPLLSERRLQAVMAGYTECLADSDKTRERRAIRLPVVEVAFDMEHAAPVPRELIEYFEEVEQTGFLSFMFPTKSVRRTEEREVVGYSRFLLATDLSNLSELSADLTRVAYLAKAE